MDEAGYWSLVDLLGGVVDVSGAVRLEAALAALEAVERDAFLDHTEDLVAGLLSVCPVPPSHEGDTSEWLAAAVVGAGRTTYEAVRAAARPLDPDDWEWEDAELLLVAGVDDSDDAAPDESTYGVALTWLAEQLPPGFEEHAEERMLPADLGIGDDDLAHGYEPFPDPEWDAIWSELPPDSDIAVALRSLAPADLRIAVADVDGLEVVGDAAVPPTVQLKVPVAWVLDEESRSIAYAKSVQSLLDVLLPDGQ